jgi:hypothetical protein
VYDLRYNAIVVSGLVIPRNVVGVIPDVATVVAPNIPSSIVLSFKPLILPASIVNFLMWPLIIVVRNGWLRNKSRKL